MKRKRTGSTKASGTIGTETATTTNQPTTTSSKKKTNNNNNIQQSKSLFNFSQAPGWNEEENRILRLGIMKFGVGSWSTIHRSGILPGKNYAQLYIQTQRMLGVQSLAPFNGIRLDTDRVRKDFEKLAEEISNKGSLSSTEKKSSSRKSKKGQAAIYSAEGMDIKNGLIVNANGANPTKDSIKKKREQNIEQYELSEEQVAEMVNEEEMYAIKRKTRLEFTQNLMKYLEQTGQLQDDSKSSSSSHGAVEEEEHDGYENSTETNLETINNELTKCKNELNSLMKRYLKSTCQ
ncbi:hypothetical protein C9374_004695 [Naegleria lovaniensis]|uniref:Myb-like domain-containing protein n=1 Tax=Naegleria lovaniensis TaxID=51637 RepID=A0AA88KKS7_NAELO|nr:uncharacterized protein C9374_004695 [Naegleria lovaniensis]KAG2383358.1 hypothetical protein C9374_004695 [Naegleria lovaniensis]